MKQFLLRISITFLIILFLGYGTYYFFSAEKVLIPSLAEQQDQELISTLLDEQQRQELIATIWESVHNDLKQKGYLQKGTITEQSIPFIKETIKQNLAYLDGNTGVHLLENLLTESIIASHSFLEWCPCILPAQRVDLAFQIIRDIKKQFPDKQQQLTYVSLGSGDLLQDYIIMAQLLDEGYCTIHFIGIDFNYQHIVHITITNKKKHATPTLDASQVDKTVLHAMNAFKTKLEKRLASKPELHCSLEITPYTSAYTYITATTKGLENKADILVIADPARYLPYLKVTDLADANIIELSDNGLLIIMPEEQAPKAYLPLSSSKRFLKEDLKRTKELIKKSKNRNELKNNLVAYIHDKKRKITYYADPFITFQDLVRHASKPTTLVYGLYAVPEKDVPRVIKIDREPYKTADIVTPHIGRDLTSVEMPTEDYQEVAL